MLDEKFVLEQILSNIIQHDFFLFYEMLDEIAAFERIQHFVHHSKFRILDEMLDPFKSASAVLMQITFLCSCFL